MFSLREDSLLYFPLSMKHENKYVYFPFLFTCICMDRYAYMYGKEREGNNKASKEK